MANYQLSKTGAEIDAALDLAIEHETSKADVAGNLPAGEALHAQNADFATQIETDREIEDADEACPPIVFGTVGGEAEVQSGLMKFEELRGNTIKWNQLARTNALEVTSGITPTANSDGSVNFSGTSDAAAYVPVGTYKRVNGHKYLLFTGDYKNDGGIRIYASESSLAILSNYNYKIWTESLASETAYVRGYVSTSGVEVDVSNVFITLFDLTDIYGAGNEPSTVAEFFRDFPKPYYAYNAGTLLSSKSASLISVGRNQWDEQWELGGIRGTDGTKNDETDRIRSKNFIEVLPNTEYCFIFPSPYGRLYEYDGNKNFIGQLKNLSSAVGTATTSLNAKYIMFATKGTVTTYNHDICIYINWDTPGLPYVAYEKNTVTLPNLELRSVPDFANNATICDVAYQAGGGTRKVGIVDLGTLDWQYSSQNGRFYVSFSGIEYKGTDAKTNMLCGKYETSTYNANEDKTISGASSVSVLYVKDSAYSDAATFKTAMDGVMLVYELKNETDITTTENPGWDEYISVDNFGTLQFTQEPSQNIPVPQAYFIRYTVNPTEFLDTLGENAGWDADNVALKSDIVVPDAPTTDGTYTLKVTVSGGTPTYSWVSDS